MTTRRFSGCSTGETAALIENILLFLSLTIMLKVLSATFTVSIISSITTTPGLAASLITNDQVGNLRSLETGTQVAFTQANLKTTSLVQSRSSIVNSEEFASRLSHVNKTISDTVSAAYPMQLALERNNLVDRSNIPNQSNTSSASKAIAQTAQVPATLRSVPFQACAKFSGWKRPTEQEQRLRFQSNRRYRDFSTTTAFWRDPIFVRTAYGLSATGTMYNLSGLWGDQANNTLISNCHTSHTIEQSKARKEAEIWLLHYRLDYLKWDGQQYIATVSHTGKGGQIIQFQRQETRPNITIRVIHHLGGRQVEITTQGVEVATGGERLNAPIAATFPTITGFGTYQLFGGFEAVKSVYDEVQDMEQNRQKLESTLSKLDQIELLSHPFTEVSELPGQLGAKRKPISYKDYLILKLKVQEQIMGAERISTLFKHAQNYVDRLDQAQQPYGRSTATRIKNEFTSFWRENEQRNLTSRTSNSWAYAIEESLISTKKLLEGSSKTGFEAFFKLIGFETFIESLKVGKAGELAIQLKNAQEYLGAVEPALQKLSQASKTGNQDQANNALLEIAAVTIEWADESDLRSSAILIREQAMQLQTLIQLVNDRSMQPVLSEFDKIYLNAVGSVSAFEIVSQVISAIAHTKTPFIEKLEAFQKVTFSALQFSYQEDVRRQYERLAGDYDRNRRALKAVNNAMTSSGQQVGLYLLKTRSDVASIHANGSYVIVTQEGVIYPP